MTQATARPPAGPARRTRPPARRTVAARRIAVLAALAALAVGACSGGSSVAPIQPPSSSPAASSSAAPSPEPSTAPATAPASQGAGGLPAGCPTSAPPPMAADATATVTLDTEAGTIVIAVKGALGPNAAGNFVALVQCGAYDGVVFHRIIPGFVIQAGDLQYGRAGSVDTTRVGGGGPGYSFADDPVTMPYTRGTVAMANAGANTNGSQFFICLDDLPSLPPNYSIFGNVTSGMDVADKIAAGPSTGGQEGRALQPVAITKATATQP